MPDIGLYSVWLHLPDNQGPFLEIIEYARTVARGIPEVNEPGFGHLAIEVPNLNDTIENVLRSGGTLQGQVVNFGTDDHPHLIVYARDPEGNILELEQPGTLQAASTG